MSWIIFKLGFPWILNDHPETLTTGKLSKAALAIWTLYSYPSPCQEFGKGGEYGEDRIISNRRIY